MGRNEGDNSTKIRFDSRLYNELEKGKGFLDYTKGEYCNSILKSFRMWRDKYHWKMIRHRQIIIYYKEGKEMDVFNYIKSKYNFSSHIMGSIYTTIGLGKRMYMVKQIKTEKRMRKQMIVVRFTEKQVEILDRLAGDGRLGNNKTEVIRNIVMLYLLHYIDSEDEKVAKSELEAKP